MCKFLDFLLNLRLKKDHEKRVAFPPARTNLHIVADWTNRTKNYYKDMEKVNNFAEMIRLLRNRDNRKKVAIAWGSDASTQRAVEMALEAGFIHAVFVGCEEQIRKLPQLMQYAEHITFVPASNPDDAAVKAVEVIKKGEADILMKGMINTDNLLRAIIDKEHGILPKGSVMTHMACAEVPGHKKLLIFSDSAAIPYPTPEQRAEQIRIMAYIIKGLGGTLPKIALVHCSEKVSEKHFPFTADYRNKVQEAAEGKFGDILLDGPLDVKCAFSFHALEAKGLHSPLQGDADGVIFPDILAANAFYNTLTLFAGAQIAGLLKGALASIVLPSRGDTHESKFYSLGLAAL